MIKLKKIYTDEDKIKIEKIYKELGARAEWIGEDNSMACRATTPRGAMVRFKGLIREALGEIEAEDLDPECIGTAYLHLPENEEEKSSMEDAEYYISWIEESDYMVYTYQT